MNKTIKRLVLICVLTNGLFCQTYSSIGFTVNGIKYSQIQETENVKVVENIKGGKYDSYNSYSGHISIPSTVTHNHITYNVVEIYDGAFKNSEGLLSISLPNSITRIGSNAFAGCSSLQTANIPNAIKTIPTSTFADCTSLVSVIIPNTINKIESYAFYNCSSISSISLGTTITIIESYAFRDCSSLISIDIPNSVTSIGQCAFQGCSSLVSVNISNNINKLEDETFRGCSSLSSVIIPDNVTEMGRSVFRECTSLNEVQLSNGISKIPYNTFQDCLSLPTINIPNNIKTIEAASFQGCTSLKSISIPKTVTTVQSHAFYGCTSMESAEFGYVNIGDDLGCEIQDSAFCNCSLLNTVVFHDNSGRYCIRMGTFVKCPSLKSIYSYNVDPPYINRDPWWGTFYHSFDEEHYESTNVYVPIGSLERYKGGSWGLFKHIYELGSSTSLKESPTNNTEHFDIYNLQGEEVRNNVTWKEIQSLPYSIYVIKGRKVLVGTKYNN